MARVTTHHETPEYLLILRLALASGRSVPEQIREYVYRGLASDLDKTRPQTTIHEFASPALVLPDAQTKERHDRQPVETGAH